MYLIILEPTVYNVSKTRNSSWTRSWSGTNSSTGLAYTSSGTRTTHNNKSRARTIPWNNRTANYSPMEKYRILHYAARYDSVSKAGIQRNTYNKSHTKARKQVLLSIRKKLNIYL